MQWMPHHQYHGPCPYNANVQLPGMAITVPRTGFQPTQILQIPPGQALAQRPILHYPLPPNVVHTRPNLVIPPQPHPVQPHSQLGYSPWPHINTQDLFYLHATYRVGMLGIDTLARRVHDERTQVTVLPQPSLW